MHIAMMTWQLAQCIDNLTVYPNSLSPFNGHCLGEPGLAGAYYFIEAKYGGSGGDNYNYKTCKAPVRSSLPTNQHPVFLQAGCPSCHPTNSVEALKGKISHSMDWLTPSSPGVFQLCLWPLIAPGYLGGGLPCLSSALWSQYPNSIPKLIGT